MIKKNIIITGATSGIGKSVAISLDSEEYNLILFGRSKEKLLNLAEEIKTTKILIEIDLSVVEEISSISNLIPIRIDGFVHAAGLESVDSIRLLSYKKFDYIMRIHLYSFIEILKLIERNKKKAETYFTSIVVLSSIASDNGGIGQTMYSASKAALESAVRVLSKELAHKRIRINAVKPGIVDTEMTHRWMERIGISDINEVHKLQVSGISQPSDIANLIVFLLSDVSYQIAGAKINIDGGGPSGKIF